MSQTTGAERGTRSARTALTANDRELSGPPGGGDDDAFRRLAGPYAASSTPMLANARFGRGRGGRAARDAVARLARTATVRRPKLASLTAIYRHALTTGFSRGFLVTAGMMLLALIITIAAIRVKRADLGEARL